MRLSWYAVAPLIWAGTGGAWTRADDWTATVFPVRSYDFGTVAKGSKVRHSFPIINSTKETIHIASYKAKCGCTDVRLGAREIPPGTQTTVESVIDTTQFVGAKPSGFTLTLDRPTPLVIDYSTTCFIQGELTLNPGVVDFGIVNRAAGAKTVLNLSYNGAKPDWEVTNAWTVTDHVSARLDEQGRSSGGAVTYMLTATLAPSAPVGTFKDEITLKTNDPTSPKIPISVAGVIQANVTVAPSVINLGPVKAGDTVSRTFIVRSSQPFSLTGVESSKNEVVATFASNQAKPLHSLTFTCKAPATPGPFNASLAIQTDIKDEPPTKLMVFATVVP